MFKKCCFSPQLIILYKCVILTLSGILIIALNVSSVFPHDAIPSGVTSLCEVRAFLL